MLATDMTASGTPEEKLRQDFHLIFPLSCFFNRFFFKVTKNAKFIFYRWAFKMYDKDGSGSIELPEMIEIIGTLYEMEGVPKVTF